MSAPLGPLLGEVGDGRIKALSLVQEATPVLAPATSSGSIVQAMNAAKRLEKRSSDYCPLSYDPIERGMQGRYLSVLRPTSGHRE